MNNIVSWEELQKETKFVDYTAIKSGAELIKAIQDDGLKWAIATAQHIKKHKDIEIDPAYLSPWFCNAIEVSTQIREKRNENELKNLQEDSDLLNALLAHGVEGWDGYLDVVKVLRKS